MKRLVKNNVSWIGKIDWELKKFHGDDYSVNHGSSQNAYLIEEEKTVLIDTIWKPYDKQFRENLEKEINLEKLDFIVVNHGGEVDHSGALPYLMKKKYPTSQFTVLPMLSSPSLGSTTTLSGISMW